ncbi:AbrB/MazE/SpoVT family DNA-binding domain-containing protein [Romboutsia sp.]|nr:AbrB/MazE/SpoVT family DNA-binding domain-containing protein [Romboutsia sp.]HSQ87966.1 AbrB/MazE/SpoVT family DNA-binding domain-containing protein [Romboutsia sp.]
MKSTVKVQANKSNTFINIPKEMREALDIKKGDTLLLIVKDGKIIIEK